MKIYNSITELIGSTPLIRLNRIEERFDILDTDCQILAKVESFNPAGSIKDRVGYNMIIEAERDGRLKPGGTVIEPTSGNTGVGLAMVAANRGYKAIIVMPENMTEERKLLMRALGAELYLTPAAEGMQGSVAKAEALAAEIPGSIIAGQFDNPANPDAHINTTGPEIWEDTDGNVDILVSAFGTGGTVSGIGRFLKSKNPQIRIIGVEPLESPLITEGKAGPHKIPGIGANFIPDNLDRDLVDEFLAVSSADAREMMQALARTEGILAGVSSGAALCVALRVAEANPGSKIVVILPDTGERYLSMYTD